MLELKLAYKNLRGAGLITWLNVIVLSFAYVIIIWHQGFFTGMLKQSMHASIQEEIGGGQYWYKSYDPLDPLSYDDGHGKIPAELVELINGGRAVPILIRQATIYPEGRVETVVLRGVDPGQKILKIPSDKLAGLDKGTLPVLIGKRMADGTRLKIGGYLTIQWRDAKGTFDALEGTIAEIMNTQVPTIDKGQLWIPLERLQKMTSLEDEATIIVVDRSILSGGDLPDWKFKNHAFLLNDINTVVKSKRISSWIMYSILLFLAMLAIFDTQVLSIFRRRKEIGTLMALGMTRFQIIKLFTFEGAMHGILAIFVGAIYGIPLIYSTAEYGIKLPSATEAYGFAMSDRLFPSYSIGLVAGTVLIVMITVTIVSYLPTRKISRLAPTEALKGKLS